MFRARLPFWLILALFWTAIVLIRPWGDFPVNDDWMYAWITRRFAETGTFSVELLIAPALYGQALVGAFVSRVFGFSHLHLRVTTLVLASGILFLLDRLLRGAKVTTPLRTLALALLAFNPLFMHVAASFMTEVYGIFVALLGAAVWLWDRGRQVRRGETTLLSWPGALLSGALLGSCFWIRQFCILLFPAIAAATLLPPLWTRQWRTLRASAPRILLSATVCAGFAAAYFAWARLSGNLRPSFTAPLGRLVGIDLRDTLIQAYSFALYMTAFCFPLFFFLPSLPASAPERRRFARAYAGTFFFELVGAGLALFWGASNSLVFPYLHKRFPLLGNVLIDTGIGPITLNDLYQRATVTRPAWPEGAWLAIHALLLAIAPLALLWAGSARKLLRSGRARLEPIALETLLFGALLAAGMLVLLAQGLKGQTFDRYYLLPLLGLLLALPILVSASPREKPLEPWRLRLAFFAALPLAFFTTAGVHDYFRWNEARWDHARSLRAEGVRSTDIDAGYEFNGWTRLENPGTPTGPGCEENTGWYCLEKNHVVAMQPLPGYSIARRTPVPGWLADVPDVLLLRKTPFTPPSRADVPASSAGGTASGSPTAARR
ncbi:MAG: hypothetical protein NDJ89_15410 [Oligoflexia bacterium]|nr:hypothetical protein [Oligoflexia bacterium]